MPDDFLTEREQRLLAERVHAGDRGAEEEFARLFYPRVVAVLVCRTREPEAARDLAQETLLIALLALRGDTLRDFSKLAPFVIGIARNLASQYTRTRVARRTRESELPPDIVNSVADAAQAANRERDERERVVRAALEQIESNDRTILLMTLVEGLKPGIIARRLGVSSEVVRTRKSRAIKRIASRLRGLSRTSDSPHSILEASPK